MFRDIKFYKDLEEVNYYIYHNGICNMPRNWKFLDSLNDSKTGFYAEAYKNPQGEIIMVIRGTDIFSKEDWKSDMKLMLNKIPTQVEPAYKFYEKLKEKYGTVILSGYSLGASVAVILGNELGIETIAYAPYGVGDFVKPKHSDQIVNIGNEKDPIYRYKLESQIGHVYIVPNYVKNDNNEKYAGYSTQSELYDLRKHFPGNMGELSNAALHTSNELYGRGKLYLNVSYNKYSDNLFMPSNRIFLGNEKMKDMDEETLKQFVNQYYDDDYKFPSKEELDRRVRFGELIYVESYTRADGTKVSGYYRRYPQK